MNTFSTYCPRGGPSPPYYPLTPIAEEFTHSAPLNANAQIFTPSAFLNHLSDFEPQTFTPSHHDAWNSPPPFNPPFHQQFISEPPFWPPSPHFNYLINTNSEPLTPSVSSPSLPSPPSTLSSLPITPQYNHKNQIQFGTALATQFQIQFGTSPICRPQLPADLSLKRQVHLRQVQLQRDKYLQFCGGGVTVV